MGISSGSPTPLKIVPVCMVVTGGGIGMLRETIIASSGISSSSSLSNTGSSSSYSS
jgi:hypothetical protein